MSVALKPQRRSAFPEHICIKSQTLDPVVIFFISGTTGLPRMVKYSHGLTLLSSFPSWVTQRKQSKWNVGSTFYNTRNRTTMDEEGYIWFPGRSHDTINASGMNITNQMDNTSAGEEVEKSEKSEPVGMSNGAATFLEDSMRVS
ncbi:PREDICTED: acyl-coenzyme A synthetase ACSM1, mitochondrial-like isoform X8 [Cercocebus atys]|uniref:acyl-coenzyme A synthetase ACSM1, mitochondrial-like isoform X8 n=1 Tax=Cercocebus atys TaxID=9531 RepID=UPI0005F52CD5|nr:PREDICTED: acyl-coenzyme A synthetase ACSM1, mitochondrial-like isoform X8 [Cercocebus atys]